MSTSSATLPHTMPRFTKKIIRQKRLSKLKISHKLFFDVCVYCRTSPGCVNAVACCSRQTFRRGERKRVSETFRRSLNDVLCLPPFRADVIRKHLSEFHYKKWEEYRALGDDERVKFFDENIMYFETISPHFEHCAIQV